MKQALLLAALLTLVITQSTKKCAKTEKAYPGKASTKLVKVKSYNTCDMFAWSCCNIVTEYSIRNKTDDFTQLVFTHVALRLAATNKVIADRSLTPTFFSELFNNLVRHEVNITYQDLTREALKYFVKDNADCNAHALTAELLHRLPGSVKLIANHLKAIYNGLDTIKFVLETITEYELKEECKTALMKNGLSVSIDMKNYMCQVCTLDTADVKTCQNTCKNVVRGCINDFTDVNDLLNTLVVSLDRVHAFLIEDLEKESGTLKFIDSEIQMIFDYDKGYKAQCDTGARPADVKDPPPVQTKFSSTPLELTNLLLPSTDIACMASTSTKHCWTATGITYEDKSTVFEYTTADQADNPLLPRAADQSQRVINAEIMLREADQLASDAYDNKDIFVMEDGEDKEKDEDKEATTEVPARTQTPLLKLAPTEENKDKEENDTEKIEEGPAVGKSSSNILTFSLITFVTSLYFLVF